VLRESIEGQFQEETDGGGEQVGKSRVWREPALSSVITRATDMRSLAAENVAILMSKHRGVEP
jgi:hypothetical protein